MKYRNRLSRSILVRCLAFAALLCAAMVAAGGLAFRGDDPASMGRGLLILAACGVILGAAFIGLMAAWLRQRVDAPLDELTRAVGAFSIHRDERKEPASLVMTRPNVHTGDELEALADALVATSEEMRVYVESMLSSAVRQETMRHEISIVNDLAQRDALTGVRTKAAFDNVAETLDDEIRNQTAEFGLVMVDLNDFSAFNETHGQEKGDLYIKNTCKLICDTFNHSPVYRVGGDEFVVVLENADLVGRAVLVQRLRQGMRSDPYLEPWERVSAAVGLAVYDPDTDGNTRSVLARAEQAMIENKKLMKSES